MQRRPLGNTGLSVTPIAFGAFKLGRNVGIKYPSGYDLPSDQEAASLLNAVLDLGINLIDTAPAYGLAEQRIGRFISHRRRQFVLSTKVGEHFQGGESTYDYSAAAVEASVHASLEALRTDVLDLVFIHSRGDDVAIMRDTEVVPTLRSLRDKGLIRAIGLSGKTAEGAAAALAWADALMVEYNLDNRSHEDVIAQAKAKGVGVLVKKGLASGHLDAAAAVKFVLSNPGVASLVVGSLNVEHLRQAIESIQELGQLDVGS